LNSPAAILNFRVAHFSRDYRGLKLLILTRTFSRK